VSNIFGSEPDPADYEDDYINRVIPYEGALLWIRSTDASPVWDRMSPEQHMEAADIFAQSAFSGSIYEAEYFTNLLQIVWDDDDIRDYWDMYEELVT
jgi:hypothetical protein